MGRLSQMIGTTVQASQVLDNSRIWINQDRNGNPMLSIQTSHGVVFNGIFNVFKKKPKHPDFDIRDFSSDGSFRSVGAAWLSKTRDGQEYLRIYTSDKKKFRAFYLEKKSEKGPDMLVKKS